MALTTDTTKFNVMGVSDPEIFKTGVAIRRRINFAKAGLTASTNYEFLPLPKGFVLKGVFVKELDKCSSGNITIKTKAGEATIGAAVTVGGSDLAATLMKPVAAVDIYVSATSGGAVTTRKAIPAQDLAFVDGDMLCLVASANMSAGEVEIVVYGDLFDGDAVNSLALAVPYRPSAAAENNVSNGDTIYAGGGNVH